MKWIKNNLVLLLSIALMLMTLTIWYCQELCGKMFAASG